MECCYLQNKAISGLGLGTASLASDRLYPDQCSARNTMLMSEWPNTREQKVRETVLAGEITAEALKMMPDAAKCWNVLLSV